MSSRRTSEMWYHFDQKPASRAECRYCKALISIAGGSFGNLRRHLKNKHPHVPLERSSASNLLQEKSSSPAVESLRSRSPSLAASTSKSPFLAGTSTSPPMADLNATQKAPQSRALQHRSRPLQSLLSEFVEVTKPVPMSKSKMIDTQLLRMICKEYHPFSLVEDPEFKKFVALLCSGYNLPSRKTLSKSLLPQMHSDLVAEVKKKLADSIAVALTTDSWTSINNQHFMAVTVHYINGNSVLCSNLLGCNEVTERQTSSNLAEIMKALSEEWEISTKLMAIVTDNAANVTAASREVSNHIPCYAHTLNLIVKAAISPILPIIEKGKSIVNYFRKSSNALVKLHEVQKQMNFPELKLVQDVPTRWNSTFEMLKRLLANREPIISTLALLRYGGSTMTDDEWETIEQSLSILEVFDDLTKELSATNNVTISKTMVLSRNLYDYVYELVRTANYSDEIKQVCDRLLKEINDRLLSKEHDLVPESAFLGPRFKKSAFKNMTKYNAVYERLVTKVQSMQQSAQQFEGPASPRPEVSSSTSKIWQKFDTETMTLTAKPNPKAASIVEVDKYLAEPLLPRLLDPLIWWDQQKLIYPNLYKIAMKRLCIPASSVPCERIFSKAGQVMSEKRSRLLTSKLSQILFIQCNG